MHTNIQSEIVQLPDLSSLQTSCPSASPHSHPQSSIKSKILNIPQLAKRMNKVEKYVRNFNNLTVTLSRSHRKHQESQEHISSLSKLYEYSDSLDENTRKKQTQSVFLSAIEHKQSQKDVLSGLLFSALNSKDSVSKVNSLNRLEESYVQMKNNMKLHHRILPRISNLKRAQNSTDNSRVKSNMDNVSQEQIDKHIKSTIVEQEGRKYFGDLYLLKKGRDRVIHSLQSIGRYEHGTDTSQPYETIVQSLKNYHTVKHSNEEDTKTKILQQRQAKKNKMLTNKHMHWNVYYDMLALSKHEKAKLQRGCRFGTRYGIE